MSNTKFTPGPWFADGIFVCDGDDNNVCVCEENNWEPDSYLIATAPEMYEMLEEVDRVLDVWSPRGSPMQDKLKAALAKARGEA